MEIIVGKTAGFCYGVKRAVEGAIEETENKEEVYCLGEIVHNKEVVKKLKQKGIKQIEKIEEATGKTIIRAHGIAKEIYEKAKEMNIEIKDLTCPKVLQIHKIAEDFQKEGYYIFLFGNKNHPENIGTISYCGNKYYVIEDLERLPEALKKLEESQVKKLAVIAQTTYNLEKFETGTKEIEWLLEDKGIKIDIVNTICHATESRQKETEEISKNVDFMIIIGGKNSSNTQKLYEIAKKYCREAVCIETKEELEKIELDFSKYNKIGIMAGASTPKESIVDVKELLIGKAKEN